MDFPRVARDEFGIEAVELVSALLEQSDDRALRDMRKLADDVGVRTLLIMVDDEGDLSAVDEAERKSAVENHRPWIEAASLLGCHALRVNTGGGREVEAGASLYNAAARTTLQRCAASCVELCDLAAPHGLSVLVENHGGLSSNIPLVVKLTEVVARENFGTLPDFGNFPAGADRYASIARLMPFAKAVSAKCYDFDSEGNEATMDYARLLEIVRAAGYDGHVGIEYEGERLSEEDGVRACKTLLERLLAG